MKENDLLDELIENDSKQEIKTILIEELYKELLFDSDNFIKQKAFKKELLDPYEYILPKSVIIDEIDTSEQDSLVCTDSILLETWKNVENFPARLIESYDNVVILECLVDKDNSLYDEREFSTTLFKGYSLEIGSLFYLRIFERRNEIRMEIHNDPGLTFKNDFPKENFEDKFKNSSFFNKK